MVDCEPQLGVSSFLLLRDPFETMIVFFGMQISTKHLMPRNLTISKPMERIIVTVGFDILFAMRNRSTTQIVTFFFFFSFIIYFHIRKTIMYMLRPKPEVWAVRELAKIPSQNPKYVK